jgi:hypothetical protein
VKKISKVRTKTIEKASDISTNSKTHCETLEKSFYDSYGFHVQVCYGKGDKIYYTSKETNKISLTKLNKLQEEKGFTKNTLFSFK